MKNYKWNTKSATQNNEVYIVLFTSRTKDNKHLVEEGFKQRRRAFLTTEPSNSPYLLADFENFINEGIDKETSRMYYSVNARANAKINKELVHYLIDNPDTNAAMISGKLAAIAASKECAATKHWMFDFDSCNTDELVEFMNDIKEIDDTVEVTFHHTYNNYAVVVDHGFDTRKLMEKWGNIVGLKKDDLLYITHRTKNINTKLAYKRKYENRI